MTPALTTYKSRKCQTPKAHGLLFINLLVQFNTQYREAGRGREVFINHNQTFIVYDGPTFIIQVHANLEKPCSSDLSFTLETEVNKLHGIEHLNVGLASQLCVGWVFPARA